MCQYWKKLHTCTHESDRPYVEWCREGILSRTICSDIQEDAKRRKSYFPCYPCIKSEARAESEEKAEAEHSALAKAKEARDYAVKAKQYADRRMHEERVRREAAHKAAKEREEEARKKREKEEQERQARKEGGMWIETSGKKGKNKKSGSGGGSGSPMTLLNTSAMEKRGNVGRDASSPKKERSGDSGGRAGIWGPKKILSRKENETGGEENEGLSGNAMKSR